MALACVIPGLDLDKVRLKREDLAEAVFEVLFAAAIVVLAAVDVLELQGGEAHHECFARGVRAGEIGLVVGGGDDDVALGVEGPGVPVHGAVDGGVGGEEVGAAVGSILEGWDKVDWMSGVRHDLLEHDFPAVVHGVLSECVLACTSIKSGHKWQAFICVVRRISNVR